MPLPRSSWPIRPLRLRRWMSPQRQTPSRIAPTEVTPAIRRDDSRQDQADRRPNLLALARRHFCRVHDPESGGFGRLQVRYRVCIAGQRPCCALVSDAFRFANPKGHGMAENSVPKIGPTSANGPLAVRPGVGGGTSLSMQRRAHDSRFATRYFVGHGIDVGGGHDSLALFVELFPLIRNVVIYDAPQGDAQKLVNVDDESF